MPITVVQAASSGAGGFPLSFTNPVTPGNTVVVVVNVVENGAPVVASPTLGGNAVADAYPIWNVGGTNAVQQAGSGNVATSAWVFPNCPAANSINFVTQNISFNAGVIAYEVSGLGTAPIIDVSNNAVATSTAIDSGASGNTRVAPAFILGCAATGGGAAAGAAGFTNITNNRPNSWAGYQIATAAGSSYDWAQTATSGGWAAGVAAIVGSAVGAPVAASFAGGGVLSASIAPRSAATAALAASGALAAAMAARYPVAAALAGSGALTATVTPQAVLGAALAGDATLSVAVTATFPVAAALSAAGALHAAAHPPAVLDAYPDAVFALKAETTLLTLKPETTLLTVKPETTTATIGPDNTGAAP